MITVVEGCAALISRFMLGFSQSGHFFWNPDIEKARSNWNAHSAALDQEIGGLRASGAKNNLEFPQHAQACGAAYGDSFIGGADVPEGEGWVERLSHSLGCLVANYAVGNYGTDQAYMLYQKVSDHSPMVMLGIDPNAIMDIVSQYDGFLSSESEPYLLKGRFIVDPLQHLKWISLPRLDANGFAAFHRNPAEVLPHSYFLPDTPDGPVTFRFPLAATLARVALMQRLHLILLRRAEWSGLYDANHPSGALQLMVSICEAFVELANARNQRALIVMLPVAGSFREHANHGEFEYVSLVAALRAKHIEVFDPGAAMIAALGGRSACELFTSQRAEMTWIASPLPCGGHYSSLGNEIVAQLVNTELRRRNFLKQ